MKTFFRWFFRSLIGLLLCVLILLAAVIFLQIPINLTTLKEPVEKLVSNALNRPVTIEQSISISTSLKPVFTLKGLRIHNPEGFAQRHFLSLDHARIQVALLPLLQKKLHLPEVRVQQLQVTLEENAQGNVNWTFGKEGKGGKEEPKPKQPAAESAKDSPPTTLAGDSIVVEKLRFDDIVLTHYTPHHKEPSTLKLQECNGVMRPGSPLQLDMHGELLNYPYTIKASVASLEELLTTNSSWMEITAELARTRLDFSGNVNTAKAHRALALKVAVQGERLSSLNPLLNLDLPPLADYMVATDLVLQEERFDLNNLTVKTGASSLNGKATLTRGDKLTAKLALHSPQVQLDDFDFPDWSWKAAEDEEGEEAQQPEKQVEEQEAAKEQKQGGAVRKLLDPEVLDDVEVALTISAEQVLSGEDTLGNGSLNAGVHDGRLAIEPLRLQVPGGEIEMSASLKPGYEQSKASLRAVMRNFDIGILVRRQKPEAKMEGLVNLDVDLQASAGSLDQLFAHGNGYFDFSGHLDNLAAGIIDLWAVNLIAAIVSSTEEQQSQINCAVGRWTVTDGVLRPDVFFIDTSKIRICGKGKVDFGQQTVDLSVAPKPKRPEFFSLATPLRISGSFDDIGFGIKTGGLVGTTARFITSPLVVPLKRMVVSDIPEDGSDACGIPLGPGNRADIKVKGCN